MFDVDRKVGRLVQARVYQLSSPVRVKDYAQALRARIAGDRPVLCADHRPVAIYSQTVADSLVELFTDLNAIWDRVAILVAPTNATLAMQLQRIVRESNNPSRKVFFEAADATRFLAETLQADELVELKAFLAQRASKPPR